MEQSFFAVTSATLCNLSSKIVSIAFFISEGFSRQPLSHCTASRQWACRTEARLQSWQQSGPCGPAADLTADLAADPTADLAADLTADPTADLTADLAADLSYHAWWANNASVNVKSC